MHVSTFVLVISAITGGYTIAVRDWNQGVCLNVVAGAGCNPATAIDCCANATTIIACENCGDNCPDSSFGVWTAGPCRDVGGCLSDANGVAYQCNN